MWWRDLLRAIWAPQVEAGAHIPRQVLQHARRGWFRREPHQRSLILLMEHLSPRQRAQFEKLGCFHVIGSDTGSRYAIRVGRVANIDEYGDEGRYVRSWCFLPEGHLPIGDVLLAQKIALETFEREALSVANQGVRLVN